VRNDLFLAHESIYAFAARFAAGRDVLDAACGTGYGSAMLAAAGAASVLGIDREGRRVAYAASHHAAPNLRFERRDCRDLDGLGPFGLVVSSNTLEHLDDPEPFVAAAHRLLSPGGFLLVAVPPILSSADLAAHGANAFHASNLSVREWARLLARHDPGLVHFLHRCRRRLDFASPLPSRATLDDFELVAMPVDAAYVEPPITAVFLLRAAGG
jgi:SAM-dependent methyltransferase